MKKQILMLSAVAIIMAASCSKKETPVPEEEPKETTPVQKPCVNYRLSGTINGDGSVNPVTYDDKGNLLSFTYGNTKDLVKITYTTNTITETNVNGTIVYKLDDQGRIISSEKDGLKYTYAYGVGGYLVEKKFDAPNSNQSNVLIKYTWGFDSNLIKIENRSYNSSISYDATTTSLLEYSGYVRSSNFLFAYHPEVSYLSKFFGTQSKMLVSKITTTNSFNNSTSVNEYSYGSNGLGNNGLGSTNYYKLCYNASCGAWSEGKYEYSCND